MPPSEAPGAEAPAPAFPASSVSRRWFPFAIAALGLLPYLPSLAGWFHADDWFQVSPRTLGEVLATFTGDWSSGTRDVGGLYRPLIRSTFWIDSELWGPRASGYHLTNLLLLFSALLGFFQAAKQLAPHHPAAVAVATIAFAWFPHNHEAVCWISGRTDLQTAAALAWSLAFALASLQQASVGRMMLAWVFLALALGTKEVGLAGAAILPLAALLLAPRSLPRGQRIAYVLGPVGLGLIYLAVRAYAVPGLGGYHALQADRLTVNNMVSSWLTFLSAMTLPWAGARSLFSPAVGLLGLVVISASLVATRLRRGVLFGWLAMACILAPMAGLGVAPLREGRLILLPWMFATLALLATFTVGGIPQWLSRGGLAVALAGLLLWGGLSVRESLRWVRAGQANRAFFDRTFAQMSALPQGSDVVFMDPDQDPGSTVRTPGITGYLALETLWKWRGAWVFRRIEPGMAAAESVITGDGQESPTYWLRRGLGPESQVGTVVLGAAESREVAAIEAFPLAQEGRWLVAPETQGVWVSEDDDHVAGKALRGGALEFTLPPLPAGSAVLSGSVRAPVWTGSAWLTVEGQAPRHGLLVYPPRHWVLDRFAAPFGEVPGGAARLRWEPAPQAVPFQLRALDLTVYSLRPVKSSRDALRE